MKRTVSGITLPFQNRTEAGTLLGAELLSRGLGANAIVLALPRGGVPVADQVAEALNAPLDILVVRKVGVPWQPELAMGAITSKSSLLDHQAIRAFCIPAEEVDQIVAREAKEVSRRERLYRNGRPAPELRNREVVLVDDGLATGSTMVVAVRAVRAEKPKRVIVATPVGSSEACKRLSKEADECICLSVPEPFYAVGEWYVDFEQVNDDTVRRILEHNARFTNK